MRILIPASLAALLVACDASCNVDDNGDGTALMQLLLLLACSGDREPTHSAPPDSDADTDADTDTDADADADADSDTDSDADTDPIRGTHHERDHGFAFWPGNHWTTWNTYNDVQHVQTGFYGLAFDVSSGSFEHLGPLTAANRIETRSSSNELVAGLPEVTVRYVAVQDGAEHAATGFLSREGSTSNPSELIDMGRFMQRVEIPWITYVGSELVGRVQLAAMPRHLVLTHAADDATVRIELGPFEGLTESDWLVEGRAVTVHDGKGQGWNLIAPEGAALRQGADGKLTAEADETISVIAVPTEAASEEQLAIWLHPGETVSVRSAQLQRDGTGGEELTDAAWDPERGVFVVPVHDLTEVGAPTSADWTDPSQHTWYNRHRVVVDNGGTEAVSVPIALEGGNNAAFYITGGAPLWRDVDGEPTGAPIQISKNWHESPYWYHLYSALLVEPGELELEHTFAHSKWGEAYAAAHAQLALVGWGVNQQWDESSLGAFGESVTYDPDLTLGRSMVDDVRPFLVDAGTPWSWTGNVGGANFLVYATDETDSRPEHQLGRLRTDYAMTGPNLTRVTYAGITRDERVEAVITTELGRTDDLVRVLYHLEYTFLDDVEVDRLALFQVAADRYADNGFSRYAYGNAAGTLVDEAITDHGTTGYSADSHRGIAVEGDAPWGMLYANTRSADSLPEHLANIGFIVRDYEARIGDQVVTTPHLNLMRTYNGGYSQMSFELGIPYDAEDRVVPAGSVLRATVEYVVPPADKTAWYGESDWLTELDADRFQDPEMVRLLADEGQLSVTAAIGTVTRAHPVELLADEGVDFELTGGLGYVPVTISGLAQPDGWRLEQEIEGAWDPVDQSVEGNDFWQAHFDGAAGTYELVFNLPNRGTNRYRLVR